MGADWYYMIAGKVQGPVTLDQLQRLVGQGTVTGETPVRQGAVAPWAKAKGVPSIGIPGAAPPPAPPPSTPSPETTVVSPTGSQRLQVARRPDPAPDAPPARPARRPAAAQPPAPPPDPSPEPPRMRPVVRPARPARQAWFVWAVGGSVACGVALLVGLIALLTSGSGTPPGDKVAETTTPAEEVEPAAVPPTPETSPDKPAEPSKPLEPAKPPERKTLTTEEIVAAREKSVAIVRGKAGSGTGFLADSGILVTNAHVVSEEFIDDVEIHFPSADGTAKGPLKAELLYEIPRRDLAILKVASGLPPVPVAMEYKFRRGQDITIIGSPGDGMGSVLENVPTKGVMGTETTLEELKLYQLSIAVNPGNSGGPVFDSYGDVVGVVVAKIVAEGKEGLGFGIPLEDLHKALQTVATQPADAAAQAASLHQAQVVFRLANSVGGLFAQATDVYVAEMDKAIKAGRPVNEGLTAASNAIDELVTSADGQISQRIRTRLPAVVRDNRVGEDARNELAELWANVQSLKEYFDDPAKAGTYEAFKKTTADLRDKHRRLAAGLSIKLSVTLPKPK